MGGKELYTVRVSRGEGKKKKNTQQRRRKKGESRGLTVSRGGKTAATADR